MLKSSRSCLPVWLICTICHFVITMHSVSSLQHRIFYPQSANIQRRKVSRHHFNNPVKDCRSCGSLDLSLPRNREFGSMHWNLLRIRRAYGTASSVTSLRFNGQIISRQQLSMGRPMFSDTIKLFSITFLRILVSVLLWLPDISCASSLSPSTRETAALSLFDFGFLQDIAAKISTELKNFAPEFCSIAKNLREVLPPVDVVARLVGQLAVALAAYRISTIVAWGVRGYCADNHIDVTTAIFLAELLRYGTLLLASIILFQAFGIQTPQSFTAIVTSLTLAIGLSFGWRQSKGWQQDWIRV